MIERIDVDQTEEKPLGKRSGFPITMYMRRKILQMLRKGYGLHQACRILNIRSGSLLRYRKQHPDFDKMIYDTQIDATRVKNERVEGSLYKKAREGDVRAIQVWLYNRCSHRWKDRRQVAYAGKVDARILHAHLVRSAEDNPYISAPPEMIAMAKARLDAIAGEASCDAPDAKVPD